MIQYFLQQFGGPVEGIRVFFAPGRVNLIGEHTDYNGGYVFPAALTYGIWALARQRSDRMIRLRSLNFDKRVDADLDRLVFDPAHEWANYPKGVIHLLQQEMEPLCGLDILFYGNIPNGAGLSSSAAIELVTALAVAWLNGKRADPVKLAKLCQQAENQFVGVNCGIMDQFAVAMGKKDHAILLNCQTLEYEHVPVKIEGYKLVITNTNKRRGLAGSKYNERRAECEQGLAMLKRYLPQFNSLGELSPEQWQQVKKYIPCGKVKQRIEHVVSENHRVLEAAQLLRNNQFEAFGQLMYASHESLRDLYEVTGRELDTLYDIARQHPACIGTRMTGAGFGGCTVSLVAEEQVEDFQHEVKTKYQQLIGCEPSFYICSIGEGAREIKEGDDLWPFS